MLPGRRHSRIRFPDCLPSRAAYLRGQQSATPLEATNHHDAGRGRELDGLLIHQVLTRKRALVTNWGYVAAERISSVPGPGVLV